MVVVLALDSGVDLEALRVTSDEGSAWELVDGLILSVEAGEAREVCEVSAFNDWADSEGDDFAGDAASSFDVAYGRERRGA